MFLLFDAVYKADYKEASLQEMGVTESADWEEWEKAKMPAHTLAHVAPFHFST